MKNSKLVFDIEADDLYDGVSQVWCIVTKCVDTLEVNRFRPDEIPEALSFLSSAKLLIGHNIIDYDLPVLEKLYGFTYNQGVIDTLVYSRLLNPDRLHGHSLRAWGIRLGCLKLDFGKDEDTKIDAFKEYTEEMLVYCEQDVEVNYQLLLELDRQAKELENES
jgi:DNA polymerase III alpha subunit (gram-positive type)